MGQINQITVSDVKYNVTQATAINQKKLLTIIGARIALNSATAKVEKIDHHVLYGVLLSFPEQVVDDIASIVLWKTVELGQKELVTVDSFQDKIHCYFLLLAKSIEANLSDFFSYLDNANEEARNLTNKESH